MTSSSLSMTSKTKYFLSPVSGRVIRSTGKTFKKLKRDGYLIDKHSCFYNIQSAEHCLNKLFALYPSLVHPPSTFIEIPRTLNNTSIRGFVEVDNVAIGIVDKRGKIRKLRNPIPVTHNTPRLHDPYGLLPQVIDRKELVDSEEQNHAEDAIKRLEPYKKAPKLVYNPAYDDIIPVDKSIKGVEQIDIINTVNDNLVPLTLPPVREDSNIAGVVVQDSNVIGMINTDNQLRRLSETAAVASLESLVQLPKLQVTDANKETIMNSPELSAASTEKLVEEILCEDGEQTDNISKKCLPCSHYNYIWDPTTKKCKPKLSKITNTTADLLMHEGEIVGYLEAH